MSAKPPKSETTREPNLLRNQASGRYYGRFTISGKQKWLNLDTDVWTVAKLHLADERAKLERARQTLANVSSGEAVAGDLATVYKQRIDDRVDIKPKTRQRLHEEVDAIIKTWPGFASLPPNRVTRQAVVEWRNRMSREGTRCVSPGAKAASPKNNGSSASLTNKCIDAMRRILDIAVERGNSAETLSTLAESSSRTSRESRSCRKPQNLPKSFLKSSITVAVRLMQRRNFAASSPIRDADSVKPRPSHGPMWASSEASYMFAGARPKPRIVRFH